MLLIIKICNSLFFHVSQFFLIMKKEKAKAKKVQKEIEAHNYSRNSSKNAMRGGQENIF